LPERESFDDEELAPTVLEEDPSNEPSEAGEPPPAISDTADPGAHDVRDPEPPRIVPAATTDHEYANDEPVAARRFVYRVAMTVPAGLGTGGDHIALPSAELFIDVSEDRLRARFAGPGWPVPAGSEVRLRRDRPGVYVFDDEGGRPLEPALMAEWFEGGHVSRRGPPLRVMPPYVPRRRASDPEPEPEDIPGSLICAFLAEWSAEDYDNVLRRCERGAPFSFRIGFWRAEQTAGVPVDLPRSALRADEGGPPGRVPSDTSRAFLEPAALARLTPRGTVEPVEPDAPPEGLAVSNESPTRAIVTVDGILVGWVDAGARALFVGLTPGDHEVGAIRPLGGVVRPGRMMHVPGLLRLCDPRCPRRPVAPAP
jgi:hypothetical protein